MSAALKVQLDYELPAELSVGLGTGLFVCGWCFCPEAEIRSLALLVDGELQPLLAQRLPRLDPFRALHPGLDPYASAALSEDPQSASDPLLHAYRTGFCAIARIAGPRGEGECPLVLRAELDGGGEAVAELARVRVLADDPPASARVNWPAGGAGPRVAICMATYNPPQDLFERQLDSLRTQTHENWVCLISDDASSPERFAAIRAATAQDPRFVVSRSPRRLGFYLNFERALSMAPPDADFVALADQDDRWYPGKLATLLERIGGAQLAYSDARVVSRDGRVLSDTWWSTRANNHTDLTALLVANSVTGAASLIRRELLDIALPFPPAQFAHFHDHWLGLVALSLGRIEFVEQPLYDYVQHGEASLGHLAANQMASLRERLHNQRPLAERVRRWRLHFYVDVCRLMQFAAILELRCAPRMRRPKRRALRRFVAADRSLLALAVLGLRGLRELLGPGPPRTLGAEWMLFCALAWRRLVEASARERPQRRLRLDAVPPPTLIQPPQRTPVEPQAAAIAQKIAPLRVVASEQAPRRVNLLIPTIDPAHFFGGYIGKFNLARALARAGARVRIITVDPVGPLPPDWRAAVQGYRGLDGVLDEVELVFGRESSGIEVSRGDSFIATTWWTAHIAQAAAQAVGAERFLYLIQEYEPFTFAMGTYAALAQQSYSFPHVALFSSESLREYFRRHRLGVYTVGVQSGEQRSASFQNAITPVQPPSAQELASRPTRRLLFYARPEDHAARNMFELGLLAIASALDDGVFRDGWELHGIGTVGRGRRLALGGGRELELIQRADQQGYGELLAGYDVGLALMYTPHPSLVPIEMAAAGLVTVTNSFENKTAETMAAISENLVTVAPTVDGVAGGLRAAVTAADDAQRRVAGSRVNWSRSWEEAFDDALMAKLLGWLQGTPAGVA